MYCEIKTRLILVILLLIHNSGAASPSQTDSDEEDFSAPVYPQPRILRGANAYDGQFPHQVSLQVGRFGRPNCGGSIISANYIVTAAHCVTRGSPSRVTPASVLTIRVGNTLRSAGQSVKVSEVKVHPLYESHNYDIALLKLSTPLEFNNRVRAIALARQEPPTGSPVVTSGWGLLTDAGVSSQNLQYTTLTALTNDDCRRLYPGTSESVLCLAHSNNNGVCDGDSGGPAVYNNTLVGVTNYVDDVCGSSSPDGFASVAFFYDWLEENSDV